MVVWQLTVRSSRYMVFERKSMPMVAWYVLSKLSYMKRVMSEVLPTTTNKNVNTTYYLCYETTSTTRQASYFMTGESLLHNPKL